MKDIVLVMRGENEYIQTIEPEFYMVFVDGMNSSTFKHKTIERAKDEAKRLANNTSNVVHILAHLESYQRKVTIEQVK